MRGIITTGQQHLKDALHVAQYLVVPDADDAITMSRKPRIPSPILDAFGMLTAVDLDDQVPLPVYKVDVVGANGLLPYELEPADLAVAYPAPEEEFSQRCGAP